MSCHPACLLTLHCALSRCVIDSISQVPQDRLCLLCERAQPCTTIVPSRPPHQGPQQCIGVARMYTEPKSADPANTCFPCDGTPHKMCQECNVLQCAFHASVLCQSEICVGIRQFLAFNLVGVVVVVAAVVATDDATDNTHPHASVCRKWYAVPPPYPQEMTKNLAPSCTGN